MKTIVNEISNIQHSAKQVLAIILDVERYHEFIPWCKNTRILKRYPNSMNFDAVLEIGFLHILYNIPSIVRCNLIGSQYKIVTHAETENKEARLISTWTVDAKSHNTCNAMHHIELDIKNTVINTICNPMLHVAASKIEHAFLKRLATFKSNYDIENISF